jgi:hypothetical protein
MSPITTKDWIGLGIMIFTEVCLGGTVIYVMRRRRGFDPPWSWIRATGAYFLLMAAAAMTSFFSGHT